MHSNNTGDIGISPPFDRAWFFNGAYTDIRTQVGRQHGQRHAELHDGRARTACTWARSCPFRGVAYDVATGASGGMDLQWSYWNGAWANLETTPFTDGTFNLQYDGYVYWSDDPAGWVHEHRERRDAALLRARLPERRAARDQAGRAADRAGRPADLRARPT